MDILGAFKKHTELINISSLQTLLVSIPLFISIIYTPTGESWYSLMVSERILLVTIIIVVFNISFKENRTNIKINWIDLIFFLYNLWGLFSSYQNHQNLRSAILLLVTSTYYVLIRLTIIRSQIRVFLFAVIISVFVVLTYSFMQYTDILTTDLVNQARNTGFFIHSAPLAGYIISCLPLLILFFYHLFNRKHFLLFFFISCVITLLVIYGAGSRSAMLAALVGLCGFIFLRSNPQKRFLTKPIYTTLFIVFAAYGLFLIRPVSGLGRLFVWKTSLTIVKDHPIVGIGYNRFSPVYMQYQSMYLKKQGSTYEKRNAQIVAHPFNDFLRILVEAGSIGFLLFLLLIIVTLYQLLRDAKESTSQALITSLMVFITFAHFSYPFSVIPLNLLFTILISLAATRAKTQLVLKIKPSNRLLQLFLLLSLIWIVIDYKKVLQWKEAVNSINYRESDALRELQTLYKPFKNYGPFLYDYGIQLLRTGDSSNAFNVFKEELTLYNGVNQYYFFAESSIRNGKLGQAIDAYYLLYNAEPSNLLPLYKIFTIELERENYIVARDVATKIINTQIAKKSETNYQIVNKCKFFITYQNKLL